LKENQKQESKTAMTRVRLVNQIRKVLVDLIETDDSDRRAALRQIEAGLIEQLKNMGGV
jgi:hypothetical protein